MKNLLQYLRGVMFSDHFMEVAGLSSSALEQTDEDRQRVVQEAVQRNQAEFEQRVRSSVLAGAGITNVPGKKNERR